MTEKLPEVLRERGQNYGLFSDMSQVAQDLKSVVRAALTQNPQYAACSDADKATLNEGLDMILHKISRIACGDPTFHDSWLDIAGYATITLRDTAKSKG